MNHQAILFATHFFFHTQSYREKASRTSPLGDTDASVNVLIITLASLKPQSRKNYQLLSMSANSSSTGFMSTLNGISACIEAAAMNSARRAAAIYGLCERTITIEPPTPQAKLKIHWPFHLIVLTTFLFLCHLQEHAHAIAGDSGAREDDRRDLLAASSLIVRASCLETNLVHSKYLTTIRAHNGHSRFTPKPSKTASPPMLMTATMGLRHASQSGSIFHIRASRSWSHSSIPWTFDPPKLRQPYPCRSVHNGTTDRRIRR